MRLIECVPNFSEGRDPAVIEAIVGELAGVEGVQVLDVDPGQATNRTVVTVVGEPAAVEEAAFRAIERAAELIDMSHHQGEHPRMGATDVCPFVPLEDVTMDDCVAVARRLGERVGSELGIPVYLYGAAARDPERESLSVVRRGEYEGLADRDDPPDFGPSFHPRAGATAIGARPFLIAYNLNLSTGEKRIATAIAGALRESGRPRRDEDGQIIRDAGGQPEREPGRFKECQGVGWYIEEYGRAQVSLNLTDFRVTSLADVFDAAGEEAARLGVRVTGSELVGLVPKAALLAAGDHYLARQGQTAGVPESQRIHAAVLGLGLGELGPFRPEDKVIEYRYERAGRELVELSVQGFADELSTRSPAPGGGSVAALAGALSAALSSMVAALTHGRRGFEDRTSEMERVGIEAQQLKDWFLQAVDRDAAAFSALMAASRLPTGTPAEQAHRTDVQAAAQLEATLVPLEVLQRCPAAIDLAAAAATGNPNALSDAGAAAACALAAAEAASLNVLINLSEVSDPERREQIRADHEAALLLCREKGGQVLATVGRALTDT